MNEKNTVLPFLPLFLPPDSIMESSNIWPPFPDSQNPSNSKPRHRTLVLRNVLQNHDKVVKLKQVFCNRSEPYISAPPLCQRSYFAFTGRGTFTAATGRAGAVCAAKRPRRFV